MSAVESHEGAAAAALRHLGWSTRMAFGGKYRGKCPGHRVTVQAELHQDGDGFVFECPGGEHDTAWLMDHLGLPMDQQPAPIRTLGQREVEPLPVPPPDDQPLSRAPANEKLRTEWPALTLATPPPPDLPLSAFPEPLRGFVSALSLALQVPPDLVAVPLLGITAIVMGGKVSVRLRPGWVEPVEMYTIAVVPSGGGKSPVINALRRPLDAAQQKLNDDWAPIVSKLGADVDIAEVRLSEAATALRKGGGGVEEAAYAQAKLELEQAKRLVRGVQRVALTEATPEGLVLEMATQFGRFGVVAAEAGFLSAMGRYSSSGGSFLDWIVVPYDGEAINSLRAGRDPIDIPCARGSMVLGIQPGLLREMSRKDVKLAEQGFFARCAFVLPRLWLGSREIDPPAVPDAVRASYGDWASSMVETFIHPDAEDVVLQLDEDARESFRNFRAAHEKRLGPDGDLRPMLEWASKHAGRVGRLAALLHMMQHGAAGPDREIDGTTMAAAIDLGAFLVGHARTVFGLLGGPGLDSERERERAVDALRRTVRQDDLTTVRYTDLKRHTAAIATAEDGQEMLGLLESLGYVRKAPEPERTGPGRPPSQEYDVNPAALSLEGWS